MQPFANTLVKIDLTAAQIKTVLEQQWQPASASRPFLKLGVNKELTYTYNPTAPVGSRITEILLNGVPLSQIGTYTVGVNSFLASGGDNFFELAKGTNKADSGKVDLEAMVDYFAAAPRRSSRPISRSARSACGSPATATATTWATRDGQPVVVGVQPHDEPAAGTVSSRWRRPSSASAPVTRTYTTELRRDRHRDSAVHHPGRSRDPRSTSRCRRPGRRVRSAERRLTGSDEDGPGRNAPGPFPFSGPWRSPIVRPSGPAEGLRLG